MSTPHDGLIAPLLDDVEWLRHSEEPPTVLYHYTGQTGLLGIVRDQALWASKAQYLNDSKEFHHAFEVANTVITELAATGSSAPRNAFYQRLAGDFGRVRDITYFVGSLSAERDLLSQWRGYCKPGDAFAIGFPTSLLRARVAALGWELVKCVYDLEEQRDLVRRLINHYAEKLPSGRVVVPAASLEEQIAEVSWNCTHHLGQIAPRLKHSSFKEESEWRLVSDLADLSDTRYKFRPGRFSLIPYTEFALTDEGSEPTEGLSIVIGPAPDQLLSMNAVSWYVNQRWHGSSITFANNAYRDW
jgi:hypothetical protein